METWRTELYHYGMPRRSGRYKWGSGNRPFQGDNVGSSGLSKALSRTQKQGKDKPNISPAESVVKNAKRIVDDSGDIARRTQNLRNKKRDDELRSKFQNEAASMSNDELRHVIDRMNLEDTYVNKKTSRYSNGRSKALDILEYAGDVTSIALAVTGIAATIYELRKKK